MYFATLLKTTAPVKLPISQLSLTYSIALNHIFAIALTGFYS